MLRVGLVGVGGISEAHISAWKSFEDIKLIALCDIRQECMEKYPNIHHYTNFYKMLQNESLDILDICLPTYLHADYSIKAMEHGIHVVCEKPISLNIEDVDRLYSTAAKYNVKFMVAHVLRFWPEYEHLKNIYDSQKYGKLLSGFMSRLSSFPKWSWDNWMSDEKRSGLVPFDLHIHDLDFIRYAFGCPKHVYKNQVKRSEQYLLSVTYKFENFFIIAEAAEFPVPYPFSVQYRFQFEHALVTFEHGKCIIYEDNDKIIDFTNTSSGDTGKINLPKTNAYANELRYFVDCIHENRFPDKIKPEELKDVLNILNQF